MTNENVTDRVVRKTPPWAISFGLHLTLALALGWIIVLRGDAESQEVLRVSPPPVSPPTPVFADSTLPDPTLPPSTEIVNPGIIDEKPELPTDVEPVDPRPSIDLPYQNPSLNPDRIGGSKGALSGSPKSGYLSRLKRKPTGDPKGPTKETENAVRRALGWLARHQDPDGSWRVQGHTALCRGGTCANRDSASADHDVGVTGLALLAFLGAGYTHQTGLALDGFRIGDVVRKGLQWLISQQDAQGCVGPRQDSKYMYNHLIAALALCEATGLSSSKLFQDRAQAAVDFTVSAQNPDRGWRYSHRSGDNDTSVTGWAVMVLKSAELAELPFPKAALEGAIAWLDEATEESYYRVGYNRVGTGKVYCEHNGSFEHHEALTAIAAMSRMFIERDPNDPRVTGACALLTRDLPSLEPAKIDYYYWYYASLALYQFDGFRNGSSWQKWNPALTGALLKLQNRAGCGAGSWDPTDRWGCEGGRIYATAINALTLEVYYRYPTVFGGR